MRLNATYMLILLFLMLIFIPACSSTFSPKGRTSEEVHLRTLSTQGLANSYSLDNQIKMCSLRERLDRASLYAYHLDDSKTLHLKGSHHGNVMLRLNIKSDPFKGHQRCHENAHSGFALALKRETESGKLAAYSQELIASLREGNLRELAQDIDREFGSAELPNSIQ